MLSSQILFKITYVRNKSGFLNALLFSKKKIYKQYGCLKLEYSPLWRSRSNSAKRSGPKLLHSFVAFVGNAHFVLTVTISTLSSVIVNENVKILKTYLLDSVKTNLSISLIIKRHKVASEVYERLKDKILPFVVYLAMSIEDSDLSIKTFFPA